MHDVLFRMQPSPPEYKIFRSNVGNVKSNIHDTSSIPLVRNYASVLSLSIVTRHNDKFQCLSSLVRVALVFQTSRILFLSLFLLRDARVKGTFISRLPVLSFIIVRLSSPRYRASGNNACWNSGYGKVLDRGTVD